ncbi:hypothetical protein [Terricaulis sp.]|uniref:hypothetical protein n=1 Tax=Terricaulis sp. TaxID=2768686 RepID=UPI0037839B12
MDRRAALFIIAAALAIALWATSRPPQAMVVFSETPVWDANVMRYESGPCAHRENGKAPVVFVTVRSRQDQSLAIWAHRQDWPADPVPMVTEARLSGSLPPVLPVNSMSAAAPFQDVRGLARLIDVTKDRQRDAICIMLRADQSLKAGDVYRVAAALQETAGSDVVLFSELAAN